MANALPLDLQLSVAALSERFNACRLISLHDVESELPARPLRPDEVSDLFDALADQGLSIIEADQGDKLAGGSPPA